MTDISRTQAWLESLRPKTLPLAFAAIVGLPGGRVISIRLSPAGTDHRRPAANPL
jgi:hypothetical protein